MDNKFSFTRGWSQVRRCDIANIKVDLMAALNIKNRVSFYDRLTGKVEPRISEVQSIESVFAKYGITDVCGAEPYTGHDGVSEAS